MTKRLLIVVGVVVAPPGPGGPRHGLERPIARTTPPRTHARCVTPASPAFRPPTTSGSRPGTPTPEAGRNRLPYGSELRRLPQLQLRPVEDRADADGDHASTRRRLVDRRRMPRPSHRRLLGNAATSETFVGCSSCHYGANVGGNYGGDAKDTAHAAPYANLANAEICGQCHSRYSYTVTPYPCAAVCTTRHLTLADRQARRSAEPEPDIAAAAAVRDGLPMLGDPTSWVPAGLSTVLNVQSPGWTPTPNPAATSAAGLQIYWQTRRQGHRLAVSRPRRRSQPVS